jgi:hypothetical protein
MRPALAELARAPKPARVLGLAYPDLLASRDELCGLFGKDIRGALVGRPDSREALERHGMEGDELVDTHSLFEALGLQFEAIDVVPGDGVDRVVDLNEALPPDLAGRYAMVIDPGTIEHCFNIGQAMMNAARALAVGGFIVHVNPLSMFNHGFYNLNPTFYHDFYGENGFQVFFMNGLAPLQGADAFFEVRPAARFNGVPENSVMIVIARRVAERALRWPVQSKYRGHVVSAAQLALRHRLGDNTGQR